MSNLIVDGDCFRSVVDRIAAEHGDQAAGSVRKQAIELIDARAAKGPAKKPRKSAAKKAPAKKASTAKAPAKTKAKKEE